MTHDELRGVVIPGRGRGKALLADDRVLERIEEVFGLRVVPGTLNVRLDDPFDRTLASRYVAASEIGPAWREMTGQAGYRLLPVLVSGHREIAFQADERGYPEDLLKIMCEVHLRSTLDLEGGDSVTVMVTMERRGSKAAIRSFLFFLFAPGVVAGLLPWALTKWQVGDEYPSPALAGVALLLGGAIVLVSAFVRFVAEGAGTPAPVAPTERLVLGCLYRYVRNPMYLAVLAAIIGQALILGRPALLAYGIVVAAAFVAFVRGYEEPACGAGSAISTRRIGARFRGGGLASGRGRPSDAGAEDLMTGWHVRAIRLPDRDAVEDAWLSAAGWGDRPDGEAEDLPGRFSLPGFVDAHSHVSFGDGGDHPVALDREGAEANRERWARDGVAILRDAGGAPDVVLHLPSVAGRPHLVPAGRHLAPRGYYSESVHDPVEASDLVRVALEELAAGARWVKLVADFPPAAARASLAPGAEQTYDLDVVGDLIDATHAAGGRVAAHVTTPLITELVRLGIDSVEHGTALDEDMVAEMSRRGTAWTPTLCATLSIAPDARKERHRVVAERRERFRDQLPKAVRLGIPLLTGSDVVGSIPREIALLVECGLEPVDALRAATSTAAGFLGADSAEAPSAVVTYTDDPRVDVTALTLPAAVVIGGVRVR